MNTFQKNLDDFKRVESARSIRTVGLPDGQKNPKLRRSPLGVTAIVDKSCYITFLLSLVSLVSLYETLSIPMENQ